MKKIILLLLLLFNLYSVALTVDRPVKIISFAPVGSGPDNILRKMAETLSGKWKQPVIIDNKPGGNGLIALETFSNEPRDSMSLYLGDISSVVTAPMLYKTNIPTTDLYPVLGILRANMFLIVNPKIKTLTDLIAILKEKPTYGSWGVGSSPHFLGLELAQQLGTTASHVAYRDYGQWFIDVANGELAYSFATVASSNKMIKIGKLNYLAVAAPQRDPAFPNVPTIQELTGKKIDYLRPWAAIYSKSYLSRDVNQQIAKDLTEAFNSIEVQTSLRAMDYPTGYIESDVLSKFINDETTLYTKLFKDFEVTGK